MRVITKGAEPPSLTAHCQTPHSNYGNYGDMDGLRRALVTEQRGICCYCMTRIHNGNDKMKVEHWRCQGGYAEEQLNYRNLLGSCRGGEGQPPRLQHCDTKKGNRDLHWNPANPAHHIETHIRYELDGSIHADDTVFDDQLNGVLNLNLAQIKNNRKGVLTGLLEWWRAERPIPRARIERAILERTAGAGELKPYCQVSVWWLKQKLAVMV